jgi:hypothetical protein
MIRDNKVLSIKSNTKKKAIMFGHRLILLIALALIIITAWAAKDPAFAQVQYLDNGVIKIGVDLTRGGAISYLSESNSSENVVNVYDNGRFIQQSYYSGPDPFIPPGAVQHPAYAGWGWNPVQAGDVYRYRSQVISESNDGTTLYVKCIPKQWALKNVDSECTMEAWIILDENRVHVRNRLINFRNDTTDYDGRHQELPAVYTVGRLYRLFTYTGSAPFTSDSLTEINNSGPPWEYWTSTENWSALVDDNDWGLGVFHPGAYLTVGGFHGTPGTGGPYDNNTGYIAPLHTDILDHDIVYEYEYTLILGDLNDDIRSYACANAPPSGPNHVFIQDRSHCLPQQLTDESPPFSGYWPLILDQSDPTILLPPTIWNAGDVPRIYITAAFQTMNDQAEIFFAGADGAFSGDKRLPLEIVPDGRIRIYEIDLSSHDLYTGSITRLRFDPIQNQSPGDIVKLYSLTTSSVSAVPETGVGSESMIIEPNYPNPFNPGTMIRYSLQEPARVKIRIYDVAGRLVRTLALDSPTDAGLNEVSWNGRNDLGRDVPSGLYFVRIHASREVGTGKMLLIR